MQIKPLTRTPPGPWSHISREAITNRFLQCLNIVKSERRNGCKSDSAVAKEIGMSQQNISKYFNGAQDVTIEQVARFCEVFGFSDSYILRGVGNLEESPTLEKRIKAIETKLNIMNHA